MNAAIGALVACAAMAAIYLPAAAAFRSEPISGKLATTVATSTAQPSFDAASPALPLTPTATMPAPSTSADPAAAAATEAVPAAAPPEAAPSASATEDPSPSATPTAAPELPLAHDQMIVFYGSPLASGLGILGMYEPEEAAERVIAQARLFDEINGDRGARPALDVIYALAQDEPTSNGLYLRYLTDKTVQEYIDVAEERNLDLILDLQIGRGDILDEVRKIERFLLHPRVHVAIDPEYAVGPHGEPIISPGRISGHEMNDVQAYIDDLVRANGLPPKIVIVHQYMHETITEGEVTEAFPNVDLVLNMDGIGKAHEKVERYHQFAKRSYARRDGFNIFLKQDERIMTEHEVLEISPQPDVVFYQ